MLIAWNLCRADIGWTQIKSDGFFNWKVAQGQILQGKAKVFSFKSDSLQFNHFFSHPQISEKIYIYSIFLKSKDGARVNVTRVSSWWGIIRISFQIQLLFSVWFIHLWQYMDMFLLQISKFNILGSGRPSTAVKLYWSVRNLKNICPYADKYLLLCWYLE